MRKTWMKKSLSLLLTLVMLLGMLPMAQAEETTWTDTEETPVEMTVVSAQYASTKTVTVKVACPETVDSGSVSYSVTVTDKATNTIIAQRLNGTAERTTEIGKDLALAADIKDAMWSDAATVTAEVTIDGKSYTCTGEVAVGAAYNLSALNTTTGYITITVVSPVTTTGVVVSSKITDQATGTVLAQRSNLKLASKAITKGAYWGIQTDLQTGHAGGNVIVEITFTASATGTTYTTSSVLNLAAYEYGTTEEEPATEEDYALGAQHAVRNLAGESIFVTIPAPATVAATDAAYYYQVRMYADEACTKLVARGTKAAAAPGAEIAKDQVLYVGCAGQSTSGIEDYDTTDNTTLPGGTYYIKGEFKVTGTTYNMSGTAVLGDVSDEDITLENVSFTRDTEDATRLIMTFDQPKASPANDPTWTYRYHLYADADCTQNIGRGTALAGVAIPAEAIAAGQSIDIGCLLLADSTIDGYDETNNATVPAGTYYAILEMVNDGVHYFAWGEGELGEYVAPEQPPVEPEEPEVPTTAEVASLQYSATTNMVAKVVAPVDVAGTVAYSLTVTDKATGTVIAEKLEGTADRTTAAGAEMGLAVAVKNGMWSDAATVTGSITIGETTYTINDECAVNGIYKLAVTPATGYAVISMVSPVTATGITVTTKVTDVATGTVLAQRAATTLASKAITKGAAYAAQTDVKAPHAGGNVEVEVTIAVIATGETYTTKSIIAQDAYEFSTDVAVALGEMSLVRSIYGIKNLFTTITVPADVAVDDATFYYQTRVYTDAACTKLIARGTKTAAAPAAAITKGTKITQGCALQTLTLEGYDKTNNATVPAGTYYIQVDFTIDGVKYVGTSGTATLSAVQNVVLADASIERCPNEATNLNVTFDVPAAIAANDETYHHQILVYSDAACTQLVSRGTKLVDAGTDAYEAGAPITLGTAFQNGVTDNTQQADGTYYVVAKMAIGNVNYVGTATVELKSPVELIDFAFARMILGNALDMQFAFPKAGVEAGAYVEVVRTKVDGTKVPQTIAFEEFKSANISGVAHYYVTYSGIAAKEMADTIVATVYNKDGVAISNGWTDSVREYALRSLRAANATAKNKTMLVDMLNYGAAAQTYFSYNADDLANKDLTEAEKALATTAAAISNDVVKGAKNKGSRLILESSIKVQQAFSGLNADMYAVVEFTNYNGRQISETIPGSEFQIASVSIIELDQIVLADARTMYTLTIYNADGSVYDTHVDSVASYIARASANPLHDAIMDFADGAYNYLKG